VVLSLDVPDIFRVVPVGTCWPLMGIVILTPCDTMDDGSCDVEPVDVMFVLLDEFDDLILDALSDTDELKVGGTCEPFEVMFVLLDVLAAGGIIGNCGNGDSTVWPYVVLIQDMLNKKILKRVIPTKISKVFSPVELTI
jgi:hypothetical protein